LICLLRNLSAVPRNLFNERTALRKRMTAKQSLKRQQLINDGEGSRKKLRVHENIEPNNERASHISKEDDTFISTLKEFGLQFHSGRWWALGLGSISQARRQLEKKLQTVPSLCSSFKNSMLKNLSDETNFKCSLLPIMLSPSASPPYTNTATDSGASAMIGQDSLVRHLLGVKGLQSELISFLLEKIPDYITESEHESSTGVLAGNVPRLILGQLRWLDHIEQSEAFARKLIETLRVCTPSLKKEIISVIPEIVDDFGHQVVVEELRQLLEQESEYVVTTIEAFSNLNLTPDLLEKIRETIQPMLISAKVEDVPVLLKFLLKTATPHTVPQVVRVIRENLSVEAFTALTTSSSQLSGLPPSHVSSAQRTNKNSQRSSSRGEHLILETLRTALQFNKEIGKGFYKIISEVPHARDHKALDSWILLLLHTHPYFNTKVETLLKKKVQNGHISLTLLKRSIAPYADILRDFFPNLLLWAQLLCRDAPNSSESAAFALSLYTHLFLWFEEPFCRQELLSTVMTHVGSGVVSFLRSSTASTDHVGSSNNTLNTTPKKLGRLDRMIIFGVLITAMIWVCVSLVISCRELERSIFLEGIFGLIHVSTAARSSCTIVVFLTTTRPRKCLLLSTLSTSSLPIITLR
jgi:hypothetical protein